MECLWELDEVMLRSFWKASQASADELPFVQEDAANILFSNFMAGAEGIEVCPLEAIGGEEEVPCRAASLASSRWQRPPGKVVAGRVC